MATRWIFDWHDGGQMVCLRETEQLWQINPLWGVGEDNLVSYDSLALWDKTDGSFKKKTNNKILKLGTACKNQRSHATKVWPVALNEQLNMLLVEMNSLAIEMVCNSILKRKLLTWLLADWGIPFRAKLPFVKTVALAA